MLETVIIRDEKDDFFHNTIESELIEKYLLNNLLYTDKNSKKSTLFHKKIHIYLFEVKEYEYRKAEFMYYSRVHSRRTMGLLIKNFYPFSIIFKMNCSKCFYRIDSEVDMCLTCQTKFNDIEYPYFININEFIPLSIYKDIKDYYNLGDQEEFMRDQRIKICDPIKLEIIEKALHPDKIERILKLTNNDWMNIEDYI